MVEIKWKYLLTSKINLGIYIQDKDMELTVLTDRAVGGFGTVDGQIELTLHRFLHFYLLIMIMESWFQFAFCKLFPFCKLKIKILVGDYLMITKVLERP